MISELKIFTQKEEVVSKCSDCKGRGCSVCHGFCAFIDRMAQAEIPVDYWLRDMKDFYGHPDFAKEINHYIDKLDEMYKKGISLCLVGHSGTGKTMSACSILKKALWPHTNPNLDYAVFYITLADAVSHLLSPKSYLFRNSIKYYDFMVIDEVDPRFFSTEASRELYGNQFENILRTRAQNRLPTIMCTNLEDVDKIFGGEFARTFNSLKSQFIKVLRAGGKDVRQGKERL